MYMQSSFSFSHSLSLSFSHTHSLSPSLIAVVEFPQTIVRRVKTAGKKALL